MDIFLRSPSFRSRLKDLVWIRVCFDLSLLGTCSRRKVASVFLDSRGRVLATGYNGVAPGEEHCIDKPCAGACHKPGEGLEDCEAIHAEQNALTQCKFPDDVHTVYSTDSPCVHCVKMLLGTNAQRVVFAREYPHPKAKDLWEGKGREWVFLPEAHPSHSLYVALQLPKYALIRLLLKVAAGVSLSTVLLYTAFLYLPWVPVPMPWK